MMMKTDQTTGAVTTGTSVTSGFPGFPDGPQCGVLTRSPVQPGLAQAGWDWWWDPATSIKASHVLSLTNVLVTPQLGTLTATPQLPEFRVQTNKQSKITTRSF